MKIINGRVLTIFILTVLILQVSTAVRQQYAPLDLAKKIFNTDMFPTIRNYSIGEYKGQPNGQDLQKG